MFSLHCQRILVNTTPLITTSARNSCKTHDRSGPPSSLVQHFDLKRRSYGDGLLRENDRLVVAIDSVGHGSVLIQTYVGAVLLMKCSGPAGHCPSLSEFRLVCACVDADTQRGRTLHVCATPTETSRCKLLVNLHAYSW